MSPLPGAPPTTARLRVIHRDEHLVAVDKPSGLAVHRGWAPDRDTAMTRVRDALGVHVFPVHRLDRGTSGVLLMALDAETARTCSAAFERGTVHKRYLALVRGVPVEQGTIDHPLPSGEGSDSPRVEAVTDFTRLEVFGRYSLVEARPRTGRLHQIRRHLKHLSCPIIGDVNYGKGEHNRLFRERFGLHRIFLHAASITLLRPDASPLELQAPLPPDLESVLQALRTEGSSGSDPRPGREDRRSGG